MGMQCSRSPSQFARMSILRAGYHDIVSVFLLVCGEHQAYYLVERLSLLHIRSVSFDSCTYLLLHSR